MKKFLSYTIAVFLLSMVFSPLNAQFGVSGYYKITQDEFQDDDNPTGKALGNGYELAADYWFRLRNKRIEFLPTIIYSNQSGRTPGWNNDLFPDTDFTIQEIGVQFKTNLYIFDFAADCDCPTFGKQGPALHKGFFLQLAPGYSVSFSKAFPDGSLQKSSYQYAHLSFGAGMDFGVSNLVTITPVVNYRLYFGQYQWDDRVSRNVPIDPAPNFEDSFFTANNASLFLGLRLGIRLDERRY